MKRDLCLSGKGMRLQLKIVSMLHLLSTIAAGKSKIEGLYTLINSHKPYQTLLRIPVVCVSIQSLILSHNDPLRQPRGAQLL